MRTYDVIIIGGGAAGLMCAITAGQRGQQVLVLEGSNKVGKKILMSGGGRCNFTNIHCDPSHYISANAHFCKSALSRYTQWDFIALVEKHGIAYHDKGLGQLFCDDSAKDILAMLLNECEQVGVDILTDCSVKEVKNSSASNSYTIFSSLGNFSCRSLVIATGGLSIPKMGASDFGYRVARQFELAVTETRAGLVPFTFTGAMHELTERLSGISCNATLSCGDISFTEAILFTHRGLSGPAALQVSSFWEPGESLHLNLLPDESAESVFLQAKTIQPKTLMRSVLADRLPRALVLELEALWWPEMAEMPLAEWADKQLRKLAEQLHHWNLKPAATEGYRTAEVTLGGIETSEFSSKTMESKNHPGLYFIGEVVDVTGHLGGFNFQWAWASGYAAGQYA